MRVFVTGATGFVGSAVVQELLAHGHEVTGLSRNEANVAALARAGAKAHAGSLEDLDSLKRGVAEADGVLHLGFIHDFSRFAEVGAVDRAAIEAMGSVLEGSQRPLIVTSGTLLLSPGRLAVETDKPRPGFPRASEEAAEQLAARGVRATAVRLPPTTHGDGDHGFVPSLVNIAREKGVAAYIGDGANRWPAGHRLDAAKVFRLGLERGATDGPYHASVEQGVPFKAIAEVIGRKLNLPVKSIAPDEAAAHFGWMAMFAGIDAPASSERTQKLLGWTPVEIDLLEDMERHYFNG